MKDAEHYNLTGTHMTQMLLEVLLLDKLEEVFCHGCSYALAQGHIVGVIIMFSQLLLLFCGALCSIASGLALIIWLFGIARVIFGVICSIACGSGCLDWLCGVVANACGVLCSITGAGGVLCSITSSIASIF